MSMKTALKGGVFSLVSEISYSSLASSAVSGYMSAQEMLMERRRQRYKRRVNPYIYNTSIRLG